MNHLQDGTDSSARENAQHERDMPVERALTRDVAVDTTGKLVLCQREVWRHANGHEVVILRPVRGELGARK